MGLRLVQGPLCGVGARLVGPGVEEGCQGRNSRNDGTHSHGKQLDSQAKLGVGGCAVMGVSLVVVGATGFGDTSWRRRVLSQVCRGEMKGLLLGSAQLGFNLLSAPFPSR